MTRLQYINGFAKHSLPKRAASNVMLKLRVKFGSKMRCMRWYRNVQELRTARERAESSIWGAW